MDEGRKRVIGIMVAILASLHMQTADDLFGTPQGSPRTDKLIAASIQWAREIMKKIDAVCGKDFCNPYHGIRCVSILTLPAFGQTSTHDLHNGLELLKECRIAVESNGDNYFTGSCQGMVWATQELDNNVCPPPYSTLTMSILVVNKYLADHPEQLRHCFAVGVSANSPHLGQ